MAVHQNVAQAISIPAEFSNVFKNHHIQILGLYELSKVSEDILF